MCTFSSSLDGLRLVLEEFGFRDTVVSKDSSDIKGQGENEPSGKWAGRAPLGFLGLPSLAMGNVDADRAAADVASSSALSPTPVTLANSLSWAQYFSIYKEKMRRSRSMTGMQRLNDCLQRTWVFLGE